MTSKNPVPGNIARAILNHFSETINAYEQLSKEPLPEKVNDVFQSYVKTMESALDYVEFQLGFALLMFASGRDDMGDDAVRKALMSVMKQEEYEKLSKQPPETP